MPQDVAQPPATAQPCWELQVLRQSTDRAWPACSLLTQGEAGRARGSWGGKAACEERKDPGHYGRRLKQWFVQQ